MLNHNNIIKTAVLSLTACAFLACVEMEQPQNVESGFLAAPSLDVDVTVHDISLTKAAPALNAVDMPSAETVRAEVKYVVKKKGSEDDLLDGKPWTEALTLPTGETYVVEAFYGDNEFDGPCLYGFQEITIAALETVQPNLNVKVSNSLLCVSTDPLDGHFTMTELVMKSGDKTRTLTKSESVQVEDTWIWVPAEQKLELEIMGTNSLEDAVSFTHSFTPQAGYAYNLISGKPEDNWPSITWSLTQLADGAFEGGLYFEPAIASNMSDANVASLIYQVKGGLYDDWKDVSVSDVNGYKYISGLSNDVTYSLRARVGNIVSEELSFAPVSFQSCFSVESVTAEHNNNGNADVELSSTTMTAGNMKVNLPAIIAGMATVKASGSFSSSTNAAAGSFSDVTLTSTAENVSFANVSDWPYLPQGSYTATVSATCTLNSATYTASSTAAPEVPDPKLTVTAYAETSYSRYTSSDQSLKSKANDAGTGDKVMNIQGKVSISDAILGNPNYSNLIKASLKYDDKELLSSTSVSSNTFEGADQTGQEWRAHPLTASFTFDGVSDNDEVTCHVTGIPHRVDNMQDYVSHGWNGKGASALTGQVSLSGDGAYVRSPEFYVPENSKITVNSEFTSSCYLGKNALLYVSVSDTPSKSGTCVYIDDHSVSSLVNSKLQSREVTGLLLTSSVSRVSFYLHKKNIVSPTAQIGKCYILYQ